MKASPHNPACKTLEPELELYAEGELRDRRALKLVRDHLDTCARCREALRAHDELTESILSSSAPLFDDCTRSDRILERIRSLPPRGRRDSRLDFSLPAAAPVRSETSRARSSWRSVPAAALALAATLAIAVLLSLMAFRGSRELQEIHSPSAPDLAAALDSTGSDTEGSRPERRWVLDESFADTSRPAASRENLLRMYGFDFFARGSGASTAGGAPSEGLSEAGWVVDATRRGAELSQKTRYYLVPDVADGSASTALEIDPVAYYRATRDLPAQSRLRQGKLPTYRVYTVPSTARLERQAELNYPSSPPAWGPTKRAQTWMTPALWER